MILFAEQVSARLEYVMSFVGIQVQGSPVSITTSREEYLGYAGLKINYTLYPVVEKEIHIIPHGLLWEKGISPQHINIKESDTQFRFFCNEGDAGFDIFSAIFFLLTRYEEYLPHAKDSYGRYAHENSAAYTNGFLNIPVIDRWLVLFSELLGQLAAPGQGITSQRAFRFTPTYDIDIAFSYRDKGFVRTAAGFVKSVLSFDFSSAWRRVAVLMQREQDPFDSFSWLDSLHSIHHLQPRYFFLLASRNSVYDRNNNPSSAAMQHLVKEVCSKYNTGIHPSWRSGDEHSLVTDEMNTLVRLSGKAVKHSRQHYIRFTLPDTYQRLQSCGIKHDYSMGYGSINGFRASTCSSFYWYDLQLEKQTALMVHPFCYMDANSFYEQHLDAAQALAEMKHYYKVVEEVGGELVMIWHNHFLGTDPRFSGWREAYGKFVKEVAGD